MLLPRLSRWKLTDYVKLLQTLPSIQVHMLLSLILMNVIDHSQAVLRHQWQELQRPSTHLLKAQAVEGGSLPLKELELRLHAVLECLLTCKTEVRIFPNQNQLLCIKSWPSLTKEWNLLKPDQVLLGIHLQFNNHPSTNQQAPHQLRKRSNIFLILTSR